MTGADETAHRSEMSRETWMFRTGDNGDELARSYSKENASGVAHKLPVGEM